MSGSAHAPLADGWAVELEPVQLIAPDGTPTSETRFSRDLPPETLGWLYEMMVVTRELDTEFINLQRQGELALYAVLSRPGGRPDRRGGMSAQDRLAVPPVPRDRRLPAPGYHAGPDGCGVAGQLARRAGLHREVLRAHLYPDRYPATACRGRGDGRPAAR